jgi:hypothetical protein
MLPSLEDKVYAAGFVDGEGCIYLDRDARPSGRVYHCPKMAVSNTNREVLEWLQARWGGTITYRGPLRQDGTPRVFADNCRRKSWDAWHLSGHFVEQFLRDIIPWLIVKKEEARLLLEYIDSPRTMSGRCLSDEELARRDAYHMALQAAKESSREPLQVRS